MKVAARTQADEDRRALDAATPFRFHAPAAAIGLSSSWLSAADPTNRRFVLTERREVRCVRIPAQAWHGSGTAPVDAVWKSPSGDLPAISSGAASALVERGGGTSWKFKRCGLHEGAARVVLPGLADRESIASDWSSGHLRHTEDFEPLGGLLIEDAMHECQSHAFLRDAGLCSAYEPIGVFEVAPGIGVLLCEVTSDLRLDEVLIMILWPMIERLTRAGRLRVDRHRGALVPLDVSLPEELAQDPATESRLRNLGAALGATYRRLHSLGALRGVGNAWLGNEVVARDGSISLVDLDEFISPSDAHKIRDRRAHQAWEWRALHATLYAYFEYSSCYLLSYAAHVVAEEAVLAYETGIPGPGHLDETELRDVVRDYMTAYLKIGSLVAPVGATGPEVAGHE